jgi:hypothetical protein
VATPRPTGWNVLHPALPVFDMFCWPMTGSARSVVVFFHSMIRHTVCFRTSSAVAQPKVSVDHVSQCRGRCCAEVRSLCSSVSGKFGASHRAHHGRQRLCLDCPCLTPMTQQRQDKRRQSRSYQDDMTCISRGTELGIDTKQIRDHCCGSTLQSVMVPCSSRDVRQGCSRAKQRRRQR